MAFMLAIDFATPQSKVVLLDNHKAHNAIVIKTKDKSVVLDKPNTFVSVGSSPSKVQTIPTWQLEKEFKNIIKLSKSDSVSLVYYFKKGSVSLTDKSFRDLHLISYQIQKHHFTHASIIGHSDRAGDKYKNMTLSINRAKTLQNYMVSQNISVKNISVKSYGENDPIVPTKDGVSEPKNRRVEIFLR